MTKQDAAEMKLLQTAQIEGLARACILAGFHVQGVSTAKGFPLGDREHPRVLCGAYGLELGRFWCETMTDGKGIMGESRISPLVSKYIQLAPPLEPMYELAEL